MLLFTFKASTNHHFKRFVRHPLLHYSIPHIYSTRYTRYIAALSVTTTKGDTDVTTYHECIKSESTRVSVESICVCVSTRSHSKVVLPLTMSLTITNCIFAVDWARTHHSIPNKRREKINHVKWYINESISWNAFEFRSSSHFRFAYATNYSVLWLIDVWWSRLQMPYTSYSFDLFN